MCWKLLCPPLVALRPSLTKFISIVNWFIFILPCPLLAIALKCNFQDKIAEKYIDFTDDNARASAERCRHLLTDLERNLVANLKDGKYAKSGGFAEYQEEVQVIRAQYENTPALGVQVRLSGHHCRVCLGTWSRCSGKNLGDGTIRIISQLFPHPLQNLLFYSFSNISIQV